MAASSKGVSRKLTVPGNLDSLSAIAQFVMAAAARAGLDRTTSYRLRQAVDEIATNSIVHGYSEAGLSGDLTVMAEISEGEVKVLLEDSGIHYDPRSTPAPADLDLPLDQRQIGGLGVYLALNSVDEFAYERDGEINRNIFVVRRRDGGSSTGEE